MLKSFILAAIAAMGMIACSNPKKLVERGNYDDAIRLIVSKLSGKKKKKEKYVRALEDAFAKATNGDMRQIALLKKENLDENWVEINDIYRQVKKRQELVEPLLPLYSSEGYKADFRFVKVEELITESKGKAADYYYAEGRKKLAEAEKGNKEAARQAYADFEKIKRYYKSYKDEAKLMKRAKELGIVHILFKMENASRAILPSDFEREIKRISVRDLNTDWREIHLNSDASLKYDYTIVMKLTEIEITADLIKEREYVDDKTIEEGWEYVLDSKGNVVKDSSGNDVKVPKKVLIKARIFETFQSKTARVGGRLEYVDNIGREVIYTEPIGVEAIFENYAATFDGDKRALTEESKKKIGNRPRPFPSSESLVLQAADLLKPVIKNKISRSRILI
jgi:hypothetical protein